ncbi:MAG: YbeD family protein [Planctomycetia bacterium]
MSGSRHSDQNDEPAGYFTADHAATAAAGATGKARLESHIPSEELLERVHAFPGTYVFKVIGNSADGFEARILIAAREALGVDADPRFTLRQTPNGKHVVVTLEPRVETASQVVAVYRRLVREDGLVMLL